jgi:hypothetical protein
MPRKTKPATSSLLCDCRAGWAPGARASKIIANMGIIADGSRSHGQHDAHQPRLGYARWAVRDMYGNGITAPDAEDDIR